MYNVGDYVRVRQYEDLMRTADDYTDSGGLVFPDGSVFSQEERSVCGKAFRIREVYNYGEMRFLSGLDGFGDISEYMVEPIKQINAEQTENDFYSLLFGNG